MIEQSDMTEKQIDELQQEVERLRFYQKLVRGEIVVAKKLSMISALVWLGPSLVHSIHNWIEAKTKTSSMPPVETTHVVAAVVRRILRVGIIAIFAVLISSAIGVWQLYEMRGQIIVTRNQTKEIVRYERQAQIRDLLSEVENGIVRALEAPFSENGEILRIALTHDSFYAQCNQVGTAEYHAIDVLMGSAYPYVRLLSELYLLDVGVLDPLSEEHNENEIRDRADGSSAAAFWLSYKMGDVVGSLVRCRPENYFLFKLIEASMLVRQTDFDKYIEPAADIKWRYDAYKDRIELSSELVAQNGVPMIRVGVINRLEHAFHNVTVRCVASTPSEDLENHLLAIEKLNPSNGDSLVMITNFPLLNDVDLDTVTLTCSVETGIYEGPTPTKVE